MAEVQKEKAAPAPVEEPEVVAEAEAEAPAAPERLLAVPEGARPSDYQIITNCNGEVVAVEYLKA